MTTRIITPYIGVDNFKFGINKQKLELLLKDMPYKVQKKVTCEKIIYSDIMFTISKNELVEMSFLNREALLLDGKNLFIKDDFNQLCESSPYVIRSGFHIFNTLGIAISGYASEEEEITITVYSAGFWDDFLK